MIRKMELEDALHVCRYMRPRSLAGIDGVRFTVNAAEFAIERYSTDGVKLTAVTKDGEPAGIGGLELTSPGVWTGWVVGTDRWNECGREIIWHARKMVRSMLNDSDVCRRIQALCITDDESARRYLELVGFTLEGKMRKVRKDNGNMSMYSIISDDLKVSV